MFKRLASLTLAASIALLGAPAAAAETTDATDAAAGWLARQMVDGERFESEYEGVIYFDYGLTIDAVWALSAAGVGKGNIDKAMTWLKKPEIHNGYSFDNAFAGSIAKVMIAAQSHGDDPASFGGTNLPAKLLELMDANGRFKDKGSDYHNVFKQALAVIALDGTAAGAPAQAVSLLAGLQCADGSFPLYFDKPTCDADLDATAMVIQALLATGQDEAAGKAITWLTGQQKPDGGFSGVGTGKENANSTGLAVVALRLADKDTEADKGKAFLVSLQVGCTGVAANRGAIAADTTGFDEFTVTRATAGGIQGLAGIALADLDSANAIADIPTLKCDTGGTGGGTLPTTGVQLWMIIVIGAALVSAGAGVVVFGRRKA